IVKGKSSKSFTGSDFDSYRNTYIGFVFQEYNLLNEFSVEQNISIALQLQSKPSDKQAVENILESVDLKGLGKRKPNTLSGGQRQRVAIARALIKDPEIIMADEPTDALDDATGRQIFNTLKKLSASRLVIVVSHDRDFAEEYGDRIIELVDGKVVSDLTREQILSETEKKNVTIVSDDTITVKDWDKVTESELKEIISVMKKNGKETVITAQEKTVPELKKLLNINDGKKSGGFKKTENCERKKQGEEKAEFIKSRLPMRHALKMAGGGLKLKPIRLVFTILLSVIAFTIFGMTSTLMLYDPDYSIAMAMQNSHYESVVLTKQYSATEKMIEKLNSGKERVNRTQTVNVPASFKDTEIESLNKNDNNLKFLGVMDLGYYDYTGKSVGDYKYSKLKIDGSYVKSDYSWYYLSAITGFSDCGEQAMTDNGFNLVAGNYPQNYGEIAITEYVYGWLRDSHKSYNPTADYKTPEEVIGEKMYISGITFKIVGVYDVGDIPEKFEILRDTKSDLNHYEKEALSVELTDYITSSFHTVCFVSGDFYEQYKYKLLKLGEKKLYGVTLSNIYNKYDVSRDAYVDVYTAESTALYSDALQVFNMDLTEKLKVTDLKDDQVYIPASGFLTYAAGYFYKAIINSGEYADYIAAFKRYEAYSESYEDQLLMCRTLISDYNKVIGSDFYVADRYYVKNSNDQEAELSVAGVYFSCAGTDIRPNRLIVTDEFCNQYSLAQKQDGLTNTDVREISSKYVIDPTVEKYAKVVANTDNTLEQTYFMLEKRGDISFKMVNSVYSTSYYMAEPFSEMKPFFLIAGGVFGLFASLMLFNFISVSIENKKNEIGILRAVGARGVDVFKIYIIEALIITTLCLILSSVASAVLCSL
ncbi:MAG: ATP-binding cassette domain-containing protein, partial [Clostridia bacterium]|nr:ATP-binding cassette domain-containing protein [Clostridia bacterium]